MADPTQPVRGANPAIRQMMQAIAAAGRIAAESADQNSLERAETLDALQQIAASLADIVALMEHDQQQETPESAADKRAEDESEAQIKAQAMAKAMAPVLAALSLPAPRVQVDVQPAAVNVPQPKIEVTVQPARDKPGQQWRIEIERPNNSQTAAPSAFIVTRL